MKPDWGAILEYLVICVAPFVGVGLMVLLFALAAKVAS